MGRPPIGQTAMTDAERMRRYRLKHGKASPVTKPVTKLSHDALAEALTKANAARIQEMARKIGLQIEEHAAATARIKELEAALAAKPASKPAKAAKPALPPDEVRERHIKSLKTRIRNLEELVVDVARVGGMPRETKTLIDKVLHPDTRGHVTEADKDLTSQRWNAWHSTRTRRR